MAASDLIKTVFIVRHGERLDHIDKLWQPDPSQGIWDPPLTSLGYEQARRTGSTLYDMIKEQQQQTEKGLSSATNIIVYTSPFQRCIDTSLGLLKGLYSQSNKNDRSLSMILKVDLGLAEWMSETLFEDGIHCSASQFLTRQQEKLARQQAYTYSALAANKSQYNAEANDTLLLPPALRIDYGYHNLNYTDFDFPEDYNAMIKRFEDTRRSCLSDAVAARRIYDDAHDTMVIFVTHAVGVNALLDGFRNQATIPLESSYCSISCLRRLSSTESSGSDHSMLTYTSDQSDAQSEEDDEAGEYFDHRVEGRGKTNTSFFRQQRPTLDSVAAKEMWSVQCTMSDSHLLQKAP